MTQLSFDDICENRHGGAETSVEANKKSDKSKDRQRILQLLIDHKEGLTLFDLCDRMHRLPNQISGRLTELVADNQIYYMGRRANEEGRIGRVYFA